MAHERLILSPNPCNMLVENPANRELLVLDRTSGVVGPFASSPITTLTNPAIPTFPARLTVLPRYGTQFTNTDPCRDVRLLIAYRTNFFGVWINGNFIQVFGRVYYGTAPVPPLLFEELWYAYRITGNPAAAVEGYQSNTFNILGPVLTPGQTGFIEIEAQASAIAPLVANAQNTISFNSAIEISGYYV